MTEEKSKETSARVLEVLGEQPDNTLFREILDRKDYLIKQSQWISAGTDGRMISGMAVWIR